MIINDNDVVYKNKKIQIYKTEYPQFCLHIKTPYDPDEEHLPFNYLQISVYKWSIWIKIPEFIKPKRIQRELYTETIRKDFGISFLDSGIHLCYGIQPGYWCREDKKNSDHCKVFDYPWNFDFQYAEVYSLDQSKSWLKSKKGIKNQDSFWNKIETAEDCFRKENFYKNPEGVYNFVIYNDKFDFQQIPAKYKIEKYVWYRGKIFPFTILKYFNFGRLIQKSISIDFSEEVGKRKGSWKGGVVGTSFIMNEGETHLQCWERFCIERDL